MMRLEAEVEALVVAALRRPEFISRPAVSLAICTLVHRRRILLDVRLVCSLLGVTRRTFERACKKYPELAATAERRGGPHKNLYCWWLVQYIWTFVVCDAL